MRTLVVYVLHEYTALVKQFIEKSIFQDTSVDFVFVCNNQINIVVPDYVKVIYRANIGHDFGAWSEGLLKRSTDYDYYICVNSTVEGPYYTGTGDWTQVYTKPLTNDIRLFGSTINCCTGPWCKQFPYWSGPHVQTYIFSMTHETMIYLSSSNIFSLTDHTTDKIQTVFEKEIGMSKKILDRGWNIGCLIPRYKHVDFRGTNYNWLDDLMYPQYENLYWKRSDLVFIKGNR